MSQSNDAPWWDPDAKTDDTAAEAIDTPPEAPPEEPVGTPRRLNGINLLSDWIAANRHAALYMLIGFVLALCIICFGFERTLLVACLVLAGYLLGSWRDGNPRIRHHLTKFYERWIKDNPFFND